MTIQQLFEVSILARPEGRALRTTSPRPEITYFSHGFRERIKLSLRCTNFTIARFIQVIEK